MILSLKYNNLERCNKLNYNNPKLPETAFRNHKLHQANKAALCMINKQYESKYRSDIPIIKSNEFKVCFPKKTYCL